MQVPPGSRYARLVRAVLVAVLHPGDGGNRIEALRRTGLELLRAAGGDAEPLGDDGVAAVFDDPAAVGKSLSLVVFLTGITAMVLLLYSRRAYRERLGAVTWEPVAKAV